MPTTLAAGDIAIVGFSADTTGPVPKSLAFVLLRDVEAGTTINYTDNGWLAAGGFRANEGTATYTFANATTAGAVVTVTGLTGQLNPSTTGDQFLFYQGPASSPNFIYAIDFADGNSTFAGDATNSNTSAIPPGLTFGSTAIAFGTDNGAYSGTLTGTAEQLRAAIANPANWTLNDANSVPYAAGFTITGGGTTVTINDVSLAEGDAGVTEFTFTVTRSDNAGAFDLQYATANGTADASDFGGAAGTLSFTAGGSLTQTVTVAVNGDTASESAETFFVNLGPLTNLAGTATIADGQGVGTIVNDDAGVVKIHQVQGAGAASGMQGQTVLIEAIVTGDFQNGDGDSSRNLNGFYLQEEGADWDTNALTSEGIFILGSGTNVNIGDKVRVVGTVSESFGLTQITATNIQVVQSAAVADVSTLAVDLSLPNANLEAYEGMLVRVPQTLVVTDLSEQERLGEVKLYASEGDGLGGAVDEAADGRPYTFTQTNDPSVAGFNAHQAAVASRTIILDDGLNGTWQGLQIPGNGGPFSTATAPQSGDSIAGLEGILDFGFSNFRVRSVEDGGNLFTDTNPRDPAPPAVGGSLTVASFNVLNFFVTLDNGGSTDNGQQPRGANTEAEFLRQAQKLIGTLITLDADVLALVELENDFSKPNPGLLDDGPIAAAAAYRAEGNAIGYLVEKLNEALGDDIYAWVDPGLNHVGTDAISVGFIYKKDVVQIADGTTVAIDSNAVNNRPTVAVTFEQIATGGEFTAVANHLKSKGSGGGDVGDGQAQSNSDRVAQAERLDAWLDTTPTGTDDADYVLLGDFNSYYQEDPIDVLLAAGYQLPFSPLSTSYVFDGQIGTLDYAFVSAALAGQVAGVGHWHIGADESDALDYNLSVANAPASYARPANWFDGTVPYRVSDHDIEVIGLNLTPSNVGPTATGDTAAVNEDATVLINVLANDNDPNIGDTKEIVSVSATARGASVSIVGGQVQYVADADSFDLLNAGQSTTDSFSYIMRDAAGATSTATVQVTVNGVGNAPTQTGGGGADTLTGTSGDERIEGNAGNDRLVGGEGADTIIGGLGNDVILGEAGIDSLSGADGLDTIVGGAGDDTLSLGRGADLIVFQGAFGDDLILDFKSGEDDARFENAGFLSFQDFIAHATQVGAATVVTNDLGHSVTFANTQIASLQSADFLFVNGT